MIKHIQKEEVKEVREEKDCAKSEGIFVIVYIKWVSLTLQWYIMTSNLKA